MSLRIAIASASYDPVVGGISEQVAGLSEELRRRGHRVTVVTGEARRHDARTRPTASTGGVEVVRLGATRMVAANGGRAAVVWGRGIRPALRRLWQSGYDLLHVHSPLEPGLPRDAVLSFPGPIVGTFHTAARSAWAYRCLAPWLRPVWNRLDARVAVSSAAASHVARVFGDDCRIIPNGVDLRRFRPSTARRERRSNGPYRLLSVSRLEPRKGVDVVLEALARVDGVAVELSVIGEGGETRRLERLANLAARRPNVRVRFLGAIAREDLPGHYAAADAFVAPATHGESFGVVLLEALASGLPILASDLPGYREVLGGCTAVQRVPAGEVEAWTRALRSVPDWLPHEERARAARRHAERFDFRTVASELEGIYREIAKTPAPSLEGLDAGVPVSSRSSSRRGAPAAAVRVPEPLPIER